MPNYYKVLDFFVPQAYLLNDNVANDYRTNMGKMKWLENQTSIAISEIKTSKEDRSIKSLCFIEPIENVKIKKEDFGLTIFHIKIGGKDFDLCNYERTMKPSIDILTSNGYWKDDSSRYCNPVILAGGATKFGIKDPFNILKDQGLDSEENIINYYKENISDFWLNRTKFKELKNYDLFQIYAFSV